MKGTLALLRVGAIPIVIYLLWKESSFAYFIVMVVIGLAFTSRIFELIWERRQRKVGSFLGPISNRLLILSLLLFLTLIDVFFLLPFLVFVFRDIIVNFVRWRAGLDDVSVRVVISGTVLNLSQYLFLFVVFLDKLLSISPLFIYLGEVIAILLAVSSCILIIWSYIALTAVKKDLSPPRSNEKILILTNKRSRGYRDIYRRRLLKIFARRRGAEIIYLPHVENLFEGVSEQISQKNQIIIAGGDGSFEKALNSPLFHKKNLGFFPLGAGNAYYSYFYKGKRFEYLRSRFQFQEQSLDVLEIEWDNGKLETCFLSIGIDAEVMRLSRERTHHGFSDYVVGSWRALRKSRASYDFQIVVDGKKEILENCVNATFGKIPYYGFSVRSLIGEVRPDNRLVYGLALVNTHSSLLNKPLRLWGLLLAMVGLEKDPLISLKGKMIIIKSEVPFPVQAGGDFVGFTHTLRIKVKRQQKVLMI
ncbi:TPA: hypothetical protein HA241_06800 [Candidatus Woesearchaeota archaeon]|nr:hypothetical protein [Candidatus Woesearchaeota archaeon]